MIALHKLSKLYQGIDLQFRRTTHGKSDGQLRWPKQWRARLVTPAERYRVPVYGDTAEEAMANLVALLEQLDTKAVQ